MHSQAIPVLGSSSAPFAPPSPPSAGAAVSDRERRETRRKGPKQRPAQSLELGGAVRRTARAAKAKTSKVSEDTAQTKKKRERERRKNPNISEKEENWMEQTSERHTCDISEKRCSCSFTSIIA